MKILVILQRAILTILTFFPFLSLGQEYSLKSGDKTFLPEAYVKNILSVHKLGNIKTVKDQPIEAFLIIKGTKYIQTYGGKLTLAHTKKNADGKLELIDLFKVLNQMYYPEDKYKNIKPTIEQMDQSILLDMSDKGLRKTLSFVSSINGYQFEKPSTSYVKLLLNGSYILLDQGVKSNIKFNLNGQILNNNKWDKYIINRVNLVDVNNPVGYFHSITLLSKKGDKNLKLAFTYNNDMLSWEAFNFEIHKGNEIIIKNDKTINLIRK